MADAPVMVFGASGHGKVVADAVRASGRRLIGFADDDTSKRGRQVAGAQVVAVGMDEFCHILLREGAEAIVAIGDNRARRRVHDGVAGRGARLGTVIHPTAVVGDGVLIGSGTVIFAGVVVQPDSIVGENVILNTSCSVDHDNRIGDHVHVSPGARLGGNVVVGEGTHVGIGVTLRNNVTVGAWSLLGAGAVVVRDVPDRVVAYGCPARPVREHDG